MSSTSRPQHQCHCWIPVLATVLILFSAFDIGFGIAFGSFADELAELGEQVESEKTGMRVANIFRTLSGGLVNLGNSALGVQIRELVAALPPLWLLALVAWVRVLLAICGFVLGWALAFRLRFSVPVIPIYALASICWSAFSLFVSRELYYSMYSNDVLLDMWILLILNLFFHMLWPGYLGLRIWTAKRSGDLAAWE